MVFVLSGAKLFLFFLLVAAGGFLWGDYQYSQERLPSHYYLESQAVGELTQPVLTHRLVKLPLNKLVGKPYYFSYGDKHYPFKPWQLGANPLYQETIEHLFREANAHPYWEHLWQRLRGNKMIFSLRWQSDEIAMAQYLKTFQKKVNAPVVQARFYMAKEMIHDQGRQISPPPKAKSRNVKQLAVRTQLVLKKRHEVPGRVLDIAKSKIVIRAELAKGHAVIPLVVSLIPPKTTLQDLARVPHPARLAHFTTYYGTHDSPNRIHNIQLIAAWIHNTVLEPGAVFSLLSRTGRFTPEEGYRQAFVIVGDELVPQYGGGACQIGTTLYNAVQLADLDVLARANHGIYFSIYPLGRDATIYPPAPDFRFRNNTAYPIFIYATATRKFLSFEIYGEHHDRKVIFTPPLTYRTRSRGFSVLVERIVSLHGKEIKREQIRSHYIAHGDYERVKVRAPEPWY